MFSGKFQKELQKYFKTFHGVFVSLKDIRVCQKSFRRFREISGDCKDLYRLSCKFQTISGDFKGVSRGEFCGASQTFM